jgi:hypothetical protein
VLDTRNSGEVAHVLQTRVEQAPFVPCASCRRQRRAQLRIEDVTQRVAEQCPTESRSRPEHERRPSRIQCDGATGAESCGAIPTGHQHAIGLRRRHRMLRLAVRGPLRAELVR